MGLVEIQSKLYANALLASLNARSYIWKRGKVAHDASSHSGQAVHGWRTAAHQITVLRETVQVVDEVVSLLHFCFVD
ncbi:hypothetical protein OE88DRAFT_1660760 [Heliocybe sulcata]|uniref:Uncharacterized protein n=1 Tax=Heliocybe sulcata TaxID=5364 RepID=A0A5C3N2S0_9AGAM|nr:hypothetical protein OE88DRAFT_1660760 [Heliocybe sulcata]